jgi:hypothetical protein
MYGTKQLESHPFPGLNYESGCYSFPPPFFFLLRVCILGSVGLVASGNVRMVQTGKVLTYILHKIAINAQYLH